MWQRADAAGRVIELAWIGLRVNDELRNRFERQLWIDHQYLRCLGDKRDWREARGIITGILDDHRAHDEAARSRYHERVAIGIGGGGLAGANSVAGAGLVFDEHILPEQ